MQIYYATIHYTNYTTLITSNLTTQYTNYTNNYHKYYYHNYNYKYNYTTLITLQQTTTTTTLHFTTLHYTECIALHYKGSCNCNYSCTLQPLQKTQLQPPFGPSVDSLCHPCHNNNLSYRFPISETSATNLRGTTGIHGCDRRNRSMITSGSKE